MAKRALSILLCFLAVLLMPGCGAAAAPAETGPESAFTVDILSTGKSDCVILRMDGLVVVCDTADADDYDAIDKKLRELGAERIDCLILSHYDKDHIGSAAKLLQSFPVGTVLRPDYEESSVEYVLLLNALAAGEAEDLVVREDWRLETEHGSILVDPPDKDYGDDNNSSLIVTVTYEDCRVLLMGDALKKRTEEFLAGAEESYDLVKLPHHGDSNKALLRLLRAAPPLAAVETLSAGETVEADLLSLLSELKIPLYSTLDGPVRAVWSDGALTVTQ